MFILHVEGDSYFTIENHIELLKVVTFLHHCLVCNKNAAVQSGYKVSHKFFAALSILKLKYVLEFSKVFWEKLVD